MKQWTKIIQTSLQTETGKGSARRFALCSIVLTLLVITALYTNSDNLISVSGILSGLIVSLAGVKAYQEIKSK